MVPFVHLNELLELVIAIYEKSEFKDFEEYSHTILNKFSEEFLALWYLSNLKTKQSLELVVTNNPILGSKESFEFEKALLLEVFGNLEELKNIGDKFFETQSAFSKTMWTVAGEDPHYVPPIKRNKFR